MKNILIRTFMLIGAPLLLVKIGHAQNSQPLSEFNRIRIEDDIEVELLIADRYSLYSENANVVDARVNNNELVITRKSGGDRRIKVYTRELTGIRMDGATKLIVQDTIIADQMFIHLDGASKAFMLAKVKNIRIDMDGGSSLEIKGSADMSVIKADGAAKLRATGLNSGSVSVETDGAASAHVNVAHSLNAKADGASGVRFTGTPQNKNISIDGLATVKSLEGSEVFDADKTEETIVGEDGDTTRIKMGKRKLMIIEDKDNDRKEWGFDEDEDEERKRRMKGVWGGFELGLQGFTTSDMNFNMPASYDYLNTNVGESWFFALNSPELDGHIIRNKLAVTTGLGIVWNNVHFEGNDVLLPNADSMAATPSPAGVNLSLNKLYTFDITAPLLIKFAPGTRKNAKKGFHIAVGAIVHYVMNKRVVTETSSGGYDQRVVLKDDFNINPLRADGTVRIGYNRIKLFANYSLTPYFNTSKGPDVRLFSAGLTLVGF